MKKNIKKNIIEIYQKKRWYKGNKIEDSIVMYNLSILPKIDIDILESSLTNAIVNQKSNEIVHQKIQTTIIKDEQMKKFKTKYYVLSKLYYYNKYDELVLLIEFNCHPDFHKMEINRYL